MTALSPQLRTGVATMLKNALIKCGATGSESLAERLEEACHAQAQRFGPSCQADYMATYDGLCRALPEKYGDFLEATLAVHIANGRVAPESAVTPEVHEAHLSVDPRQRMRSHFYEILSRDARFGTPGDQRLRDYATRIERGCYNASILRCTESAESYRRQWDSPMFRNVYSSRCGIISANIDPLGSVVQGVEEGTWALDRLASGVWPPEDLGAMSAAELCPRAGQAERDEVRRRLDQKVCEKTSALFACPRCHKRNHTYRQVQIGSGDEPSTFMCTCKECGNNYEGYA
jgi:hypothetical protein